MKKITTLIFIGFLASTMSFAQGNLDKGEKQVNAGFGFSNFGTPVYVGLDYGVTDDISVGGSLSYRSKSFGFFRSTVIGVVVNGNYHFNNVLDLPEEFDFYAGLGLGYYSVSSKLTDNNSIFGGSSFGTNSGVRLDFQIGGRYFLSERAAINLEFGGGFASGGRVGITYRL